MKLLILTKDDLLSTCPVVDYLLKVTSVNVLKAELNEFFDSFLKTNSEKLNKVLICMETHNKNIGFNNYRKLTYLTTKEITRKYLESRKLLNFEIIECQNFKPNTCA